MDWRLCMQLLLEETVTPLTLTGSVVEKTPTTRNSRKSNKLPLEILMRNIRGMFKNYTEYREFVIKHNLVKNGYPLNPKPAYGYKLTVDEFLGNPEGTFRQDCSRKFIENKIWMKGHEHRKRNGYKRKSTRQVESQIADTVITISNNSINMSVVCDFLISRGMTGTVRNILSEDKVTLEDAKMITTSLLKTYESKTTVNK